MSGCCTDQLLTAGSSSPRSPGRARDSGSSVIGPCTALPQVGSVKWHQQHEWIEQLNLQVWRYSRAAR
jgi:hypothetical protein